MLEGLTALRQGVRGYVEKTRLRSSIRLAIYRPWIKDSMLESRRVCSACLSGVD